MNPSKLILEAPFASAETMIQDASGLALPSEFFTTLKINNAEEIKSVTQPFCWIHGEDDDFFSEGRSNHFGVAVPDVFECL
jgi:hypothetical protein